MGAILRGCNPTVTEIWELFCTKKFSRDLVVNILFLLILNYESCL